MAKQKVETEQLELTPAEIQAIVKAREATGTSEPNVAVSDLAAALIQAINATKPPEKKNSFNRPRSGPWEPKPGQKKPKLRRTMYHHGLELTPSNLTVEEIELLNKIKAGSYCGGWVRVIKRKDRSLDIDYRVRTASDRLKLVNQHGITNFASLLQRCIAEAEDPKKFKGPDEDDDD